MYIEYRRAQNMTVKIFEECGLLKYLMSKTLTNLVHSPIKKMSNFPPSETQTGTTQVPHGTKFDGGKL